MSNQTTTEERHLTLTEQRILHRALQRAIKFACQECGWWNSQDLRINDWLRLVLSQRRAERG